MKPNRTETGFSARLNRRKKQLDDRFRLVIPDWEEELVGHKPLIDSRGRPGRA
jgi:hypothetical protein